MMPGVNQEFSEVRRLSGGDGLKVAAS
jgi:hypothetical protein